MLPDIAAIMKAGLDRNGALVAVVAPTSPPNGAVYNYDFKVMIVGSGRHRVVHHDGVCPVPAGGFVIYRPGSWHQTTTLGPRRYASLIVSADRLRFFANQQPQRTGPRLTRVELRQRPSDRVLDHLMAALSASHDADPGLADLARALLRHCLPLLDQPATIPTPTWLAVRTHIETYVHRPLSRDAVAAACGISPGHLSALCRRETGRRFIEVLTEARMRHAEHLLHERGMTVGQVAAALDYGDVRHFRRVFKRALGLPPGTIRRRTTSPG